MVRKVPKIYIEGAGKSKSQRQRLQEGMATLLKKAGFSGVMTRIVACGGRIDTFDKFSTGFKILGEFSLLLVDSEDPVEGLNDDPASAFAWEHLEKRDGFQRPDGAHNRQALLMATCMETWISADKSSLSVHYEQGFRQNKLPPLAELESRNRHELKDALFEATKDTSKPYKKGFPSFEALSVLDTDFLKNELSQFRRLVKVMETL